MRKSIMNYEVEFIRDIPCIYRMKFVYLIKYQMENNSSSYVGYGSNSSGIRASASSADFLKVSMSSRTVS